MVAPARPDAVTVSALPASWGDGRPSTTVAASQLALVMREVERRSSYRVAVPTLPSAPGAVKVNVAAELVVAPTTRSVTVAGGMPGVVAQLEFDGAETLPLLSAAVSAKQVVVSGERPVTSKRSR